MYSIFYNIIKHAYANYQLYYKCKEKSIEDDARYKSFDAWVTCKHKKKGDIQRSIYCHQSPP